jgi:sRNA-binding carbon storage regulator CsrA
MSTISPITGLSLVLRPGELVYIGKDIRLHVENAGAGKVRIIIDAPKEIPIRSDRRIVKGRNP